MNTIRNESAVISRRISTDIHGTLNIVIDNILYKLVWKLYEYIIYVLFFSRTCARYHAAKIKIFPSFTFSSVKLPVAKKINLNMLKLGVRFSTIRNILKLKQKTIRDLKTSVLEITA